MEEFSGPETGEGALASNELRFRQVEWLVKINGTLQNEHWDSIYLRCLGRECEVDP